MTSSTHFNPLTRRTLQKNWDELSPLHSNKTLPSSSFFGGGVGAGGRDEL
ncbi:unnamed protein product [Spirodela intermedia]|uniref:Uncharacterized protein n=1 Tax=Spirodela intermedia TaxID=51605 RepID=A0A7I8IZC5_SPIIN|nr:unnamed protein product [Spirodela intermedia]CAA6662373.1 unnamed protein product [Spirodela intermedia]